MLCWGLQFHSPLSYFRFTSNKFSFIHTVWQHSVRFLLIFEYSSFVGSMQPEFSRCFYCDSERVLKYEILTDHLSYSFLGLNCLLWLYSCFFMLTFFVQGEICIFFPLIILRSLDGAEFPVNQKTSVLRYNIHSEQDVEINLHTLHLGAFYLFIVHALVIFGILSLY